MSRPAPAARSGASPPGSPPVRTPHRDLAASAAQAPAVSSPTSPRSSFLGNFIRGRSRAASVTNAVAGAVRGRVASPSAEVANPLGSDVTRTLSTPGSADATSVVIPPVDPALRRPHKIRLVPVLETNRSFTFAPVLREMGVMHVPAGILPSIAAASISDIGPTVNGRPPPLLIKIGRFTDRSGANAAAAAATTGAGAAAAAAPSTTPTPATTGGAAAAAEGANGAAAGAGAVAAASAAGGGETLSQAPPTPAANSGGGGGDLLSPRAAFKSKVVSRAHAEIWCEPGGKFYIRDTASSSGTFLNHIRLSSPNVQSRPQMLKDGDVLQLGVDYQGGAEEMYRCVKMRVELGRDWQRGANEFNVNALKQLKALGGGAAAESASELKAGSSRPKGKASVTDCCICLFSVTVCQSLFIAPCSHVFHYKCIRPLLNQHHPGFSCPLCRTFANLEEDVETEDAWEIASRRVSVISRRNSNHSIRLPPQNDTPSQQPVVTPGEPSTGVGFGEASASLDELLAASSGQPSENGDALVAELRPDLARQMTAVSNAPREMGSGLGTPSDMEDGTTVTHATTAPVPMPNSGVGQLYPDANAEGTHLGATAASLAQTPLNDVFLSTLVISGGPRSDTGSATNSLALSQEIAEEPEAEARAEAAAAGRFVDDDHILDEVNA